MWLSESRGAEGLGRSQPVLTREEVLFLQGKPCLFSLLLGDWLITFGLKG